MNLNFLSDIVSKLLILTSVLLIVGIIKYDKLDNRYGSALNNVQYYQELLEEGEQSSRALLLTVSQLQNTKDSLLQRILYVAEENNIKPKDILAATTTTASIDKSDTVKIKEYLHVDFDEELTFDPLTKVRVSRTDSLLSVKLDIKTQLTIIYHEGKEYRNHYSNGWKRFWHFDWKKDRIRRFVVDSSNKDIEITNTRVVEVIE